MAGDRPLCIYHANCDDGFAAAYVVNKAFGGEVDFHPGIYGEPKPDCRGRVVLIVDFSYNPITMLAIQEECKKLIWIDHHKTAIEACSGLVQREQDAFVLAAGNETCGAMLTWNYLIDKTKPLWLQYIQARDLWKKDSLPNVDHFTFGLRSIPQTFMAWEQLERDKNVEILIKRGEACADFFILRCQEVMQQAHMICIAGIWMPAVNAPKMFASDVGNMLCQRSLPMDIKGNVRPLDGVAYVCACVYFTNGESTEYSLRSVGDFDVSAIAKKFGGGGHKNAAGFRRSIADGFESGVEIAPGSLIQQGLGGEMR